MTWLPCTLLLAVDGLEPGPSDEASERLLQRAEATARKALTERPVEELPHVAAWRAAYRAFGAKPQRTRNSLEALLRRVDTGLPRVNRRTDVYNAGAREVEPGVVGAERLDDLGGDEGELVAGLVRAAGAEGAGAGGVGRRPACSATPVRQRTSLPAIRDERRRPKGSRPAPVPRPHPLGIAAPSAARSHGSAASSQDGHQLQNHRHRECNTR